jgi:hypothetical protein
MTEQDSPAVYPPIAEWIQKHRFHRGAQPFSVEAVCQSSMRELANLGERPTPLNDP